MRFNINELSFQRIYTALLNRIKNLPSIYTWYFSEEGILSQKKLSYYQDLHKGKRCFLIANGPSLKSMNLHLLKNEITFGLNRIYLLKDELNFEPTYHIISNEFVLRQFKDDFNQINSVKFYNWSERKLFSNNTDINFVRYRFSINDKFSTNPLSGLYGGGTVTFAALQLIFFMGFDEVYILGLDHNFKEKGEPNKIEYRTQEKDESHFHPDYFPKGILWQLPDLLRSELAYKLAREAFESNNKSIVDVTVNGKCNVFKKMDFSAINL
ncbi:MAG: DUF115 domain-containing protein [Bacteroidetes bacterium]|nr:DUF115 domain-containing protein [Bacteroidota bacterium]